MSLLCFLYDYSNLIAALATLGIAILTYRYVRISNDILKQNEKQLEKFQESIILTKDNFEKENRPYVIVDKIERDERNRNLTIRIVNKGKGLAKNIEVSILTENFVSEKVSLPPTGYQTIHTNILFPPSEDDKKQWRLEIATSYNSTGEYNYETNSIAKYNEFDFLDTNDSLLEHRIEITTHNAT